MGVCDVVEEGDGGKKENTERKGRKPNNNKEHLNKVNRKGMLLYRVDGKCQRVSSQKANSLPLFPFSFLEDGPADG